MLIPAESQWWYDKVNEHFEKKDGDFYLYYEQLNLSQALLERSIHDLSSGEKQRLALLRALQYQPEVLLLDEPTANLDNTNTTAVEKIIKSYIAKGKSALWISHDLNQLKNYCDQIATIHHDFIELK